MEAKRSEISFENDRLKDSFDKLAKDNPTLYKWLLRGIEKIVNNPYSGTFVRKGFIPRTYSKSSNIDNVWKANLPKGWRLIYSLSLDKGNIRVSILEWLPHKKYERRFGYG
jgi:hypothetical protein